MMVIATQTSLGSLRRAALFLAAAAAWLCPAGGATALEIDTGAPDVQLRFDNTLRYNFGVRAGSQDPSILASPNFDDGDRNFKQGSIVMNRVDLLSELDVVYEKAFGVRVSAASWYDQAYAGGLSASSPATYNNIVNGAPALGSTAYAKHYYLGPYGEVLDAFAFGTFNLGSAPLTIRAGRHTVWWGETLSNAFHGINYSQAPLDLAKGQAQPGVDVKELARPKAQVSAQLQATPTLSFAGQFFFQWEPTRLPEVGTYYGPADIYQGGAESFILVPGDPGVRALRGPDLKPKQMGDWGLASRWSPEWLQGTVGLYARHFSDTLPQIILMAAPPQQFFLSYASGIDMLGISLAKEIAGVSFGMDLNGRRNMPLASDSVVITSLTKLPASGDILGARGDTLHGVLNAVGTINATPIFSSASWNAELAWNRFVSVTDDPNHVFKGRDGYTAIDRVSKDFFGISAGFTPTWFQVFPGADVSLPLTYSMGLSGNSAVPSGGNKDAGVWSAGLGLDLHVKYRFDVKYVDYFGKYTTNASGAVAVPNGSAALLKDRGAAYFTFKTTI
jgi:hypothetical protein